MNDEVIDLIDRKIDRIEGVYRDSEWSMDKFLFCKIRADVLEEFKREYIQLCTK